MVSIKYTGLFCFVPLNGSLSHMFYIFFPHWTLFHVLIIFFWYTTTLQRLICTLWRLAASRGPRMVFSKIVVSPFSQQFLLIFFFSFFLRYSPFDSSTIPIIRRFSNLPHGRAVRSRIQWQRAITEAVAAIQARPKLHLLPWGRIGDFLDMFLY